MSIPAAFAPAEARYAAQVMASTFGHLEPKPGLYKGWIVFVNGCHGDTVVVDYDFDGVNACPGVYDDIHQWLDVQCEWQHWHKPEQNGPASEKGVYRFDGTYRRYKNGSGRLSGKIRRIPT